MADEENLARERGLTDVASAARVYNYLLGGKDNYEIDRIVAKGLFETVPYVGVMARHNREFMHRSIDALSELGVRQFLDIGTGIPTKPNVHELAQARHPESRVVYVDNDPIVLAHARALLTSTREGKTAFIDADLTDPQAILEAVERLGILDLASPVALSLLAILHFIPDENHPEQILATLLDRLAPGSFLIISHGTSDFDPETIDDGTESYRSTSGIRSTPRSKEHVLKFFDGLELLEPGLVPTCAWRPAVQPASWLFPQVGAWAGVARKP